MIQGKAPEFVASLAAVNITNKDRFKALVWWYGRAGRADEATPSRIAQDMEQAGYGRQNVTRISSTLRSDRRLAKGKRNAFQVKVTAHAEFEEVFGIDSLVPDSVARVPSGLVRSGALANAGMRRRPALFIGSSAEGIMYARALEKQCEHDAEVTIWKDGVFGLGGGTLETLVEVLPRFDFAALVLTSDDLTYSRNQSSSSPRDNVLLELGLFLGHLGRERTFIVYNKDDGLKLPSDLAGVTPATFRNRSDGNYHAQMSPPSTQMIDSIRKHGVVPR